VPKSEEEEEQRSSVRQFHDAISEHPVSLSIFGFLVYFFCQCAVLVVVHSSLYCKNTVHVSA
jgi:hypothetical protein